MRLLASVAATALFAQAESLQYAVNWPTGLSLGEGSLSATKSGAEWEFRLGIDAAIPGFAVRDHYSARATDGLCSLRFEKDSAHGPRKALEHSTFDAARGVVIRETRNGGKSELKAGACAKDALTFLFHVRKELEQGRMPAAQTVFFGAPYQASLRYVGAQPLTIGDSRVDSDHVSATLKGPASEVNIDVYFARDSGRTPLLIKVPFALGTFSMELTRQ